MFGFSFEHIIVIGVVLLIFGPRRLPELGNAVGKAIRNFKSGLSGTETPHVESSSLGERVPPAITATSTPVAPASEAPHREQAS